MNPFIQAIVSSTINKRAKKKKGSVLTPFDLAREARILTVEYSNGAREILFIVLAVFSASFGLESFLIPNGFIDGGVTGISLLIQTLTDWPLAVLVAVVNLPFILLGIKVVSKRFAIKSVIAIGLLSLVIATIHFPVITEDKLLIAVFGGFFLGLGIGLAIRGGAVIDGTEVLAIFISRRSSLSIGDVVLIFNVMIFSVGAYLLTIEVALYAMITYLVASKTVDFIIDGIEEYIGVTIVSPLHAEIKESILYNLGRGCTVFLGKGGKRGNEVPGGQEILYTVLTRLELSKLKTEVQKIDPKAFMIMSSIKDTKGGMVKKRPLK